MKMLYARPSVDFPKTVTTRRLIRLPRPHLTTACETRKATTTRSTLGLAKPPKTLAGSSVSLSTATAPASSAEVSSGSALTMTAKIAAAKMANRCQASRVSPSGIGENQMPMAKANTASVFAVSRKPDAGAFIATLLSWAAAASPAAPSR
jgi:hypothetical protein